MRDRRRASAVIAASVLALLASSVWAGPARGVHAESQRAADELLWLINEERYHRGIAPMMPRDDVRIIADDHSHSMARSGQLRHNDAYFAEENRRRLDADTLGENVAYGTDIGAIHRALMASAGHRANILDARFTVVGIATVHDGERWWVTEDFVDPR